MTWVTKNCFGVMLHRIVVKITFFSVYQTQFITFNLALLASFAQGLLSMYYRFNLTQTGEAEHNGKVHRQGGGTVEQKRVMLTLDSLLCD